MFFPDYDRDVDEVYVITLAHLMLFGFSDFGAGHESLFKALGIEPMAKREELIRRAAEFPYHRVVFGGKSGGLLGSRIPVHVVVSGHSIIPDRMQRLKGAAANAIRGNAEGRLAGQ
jgi:hypothetical protein